MSANTPATELRQKLEARTASIGAVGLAVGTEEGAGVLVCDVARGERRLHRDGTPQALIEVVVQALRIR